MHPAEIRKKRDKTPEQAYAALIRLCARSEKSSGDALRLMQRWGVKPSARQGVLQKLLADRFIDDNRYAEARQNPAERLGRPQDPHLAPAQRHRRSDHR